MKGRKAEQAAANMTEYGVPLQSLHIPGIYTVHVMGECLPQSDVERCQRETDLLRVCREITEQLEQG